MQQRKSSARQKAVTEQRAAAPSVARGTRVTAAGPASQTHPGPPSSGYGETTLGGHVDRGLTLAALYDLGVLERLRLEVRLRLLSDLTQSLAWLHANPRLVASHPHLVIAPSTVVIGLDGVARVDVRAAKKKDAERDPGEQDYVAPELIGADGTGDRRADVYSLGVLAWEALAGARIGSADEPVGGGAASPLDSSDVPLALRAAIPHRDPLRRSPARAPRDGQRRPPSITLSEDAAWARPLAELVLQALSHEVSERLQDCRPLLAELESIAVHLAQTHAIAEVVQGISNVETLCIPPPTLPDVEAACQGGAGQLGFMDRQPCEDPGASACFQRQRPAVHRVEVALPEPTTPPVASQKGPAAAPSPAPTPPSPGRAPANVWLVAGLVVLALLGSIAGFVLSSLAAR